MIGPKLTPPTDAEEVRAYREVTERDEELCQRCRRAPGSNRDHRKLRSQGGWTVVENMQLLCGSGTTGCHGWATEHPDEANREGWAVPMWAHWMSYPARRWIPTVHGTHRLAWVLYAGQSWLEIGALEAADRIAGLRHDFPEMVS